MIIKLKITEAKTFKQKYFGLLGKKEPITLLMRTRFGIHTFSMKFSLDVIVLNKNNRVVIMKQQVKPNRIFMWNPKYDTVIELPQGTIVKKNIKINDIIDFVE